jgi:hypothetical protein
MSEIVSYHGQLASLPTNQLDYLIEIQKYITASGVVAVRPDRIDQAIK